MPFDFLNTMGSKLQNYFSPQQGNAQNAVGANPLQSFGSQPTSPQAPVSLMPERTTQPQPTAEDMQAMIPIGQGQAQGDQLQAGMPAAGGGNEVSTLFDLLLRPYKDLTNQLLSFLLMMRGQ